jgi:alkylated DNA repair dioxygenase AlkB
MVNNESVHFYYQKNVLTSSELSCLKDWLHKQSYKSGNLLNGKEICRKQLWFQKDSKYFCKSWKHKYDRWVSESYDNYLLHIQHKINTLVNEVCIQYNIEPVNINSCLINKYRDGKDSIKPHVDNRESFGEYPTISGFSIGGTRNLVFRKIANYDTKSLKVDSNFKELSYELENNSLFIMAGASQKYFTHEIPKCDSNDTRYSLTFREFKD